MGVWGTVLWLGQQYSLHLEENTSEGQRGKKILNLFCFLFVDKKKLKQTRRKITIKRNMNPSSKNFCKTQKNLKYVNTVLQ